VEPQKSNTGRSKIFEVALSLCACPTQKSQACALGHGILSGSVSLEQELQ
jgi:hypothetical protein